MALQEAACGDSRVAAPPRLSGRAACLHACASVRVCRRHDHGHVALHRRPGAGELSPQPTGPR